MFKRCVAPVLALLLMLFAHTAHAFFDPPYITPVAPVAGGAVSVNIRAGVCDALGADPGYPQITQNGNAIRILLTGVHTDNSDFCIYPIGTATYQVGAYPAGSYTLQVDFLYDAFPFGPTVITLGVVPFTVAGAPASAVPAPTNSPLALLALFLVVASVALWVLRGRRSELLLMIFACASVGARAQVAPDNHTIQILVTSAPGSIARTIGQLLQHVTASWTAAATGADRRKPADDPVPSAGARDGRLSGVVAGEPELGARHAGQLCRDHIRTECEHHTCADRPARRPICHRRV